jgi:hypothetical protein
MFLRLSVAVLLVALATACGTTRVVRLDTGQGAPREYRPPTWNRSVEVDPHAFEEALMRLALEESLAIRPSQQGWLVRTSSVSNEADTRWQYLVSKSMGGRCRPGQAKQDCFSLLDDIIGMSDAHKLAVALGLSFEPMRQSIARAVQDTLSPQLFVAAIGAGLVTWAVLAANPEPVFTKTAALVAAVMVIYLGVDAFLEMVRACFELKRATDSAVTFEELEEASERFGRRVGPQVARVFILAVTVAVGQGTTGGAAWLASRLPLLPGFSEAAVLGASQVGLRLSAAGQVRAVAVVEGNLVISLAPTAVAMSAQGRGDAIPRGQPPALRPEQGYLGSKKHGIHWTEGAAAAKSTQKPQGQWGSISDLEFAGRRAATLEPGRGAYFDLPEGHSSVVWRVDGTRVPASRIWVRSNGTGTFHGYPLE